MTDNLGDIPIIYPRLDQFIGTRFYQCFDTSQTLGQIVEEYVSTEQRSNAVLVIQELRQFLRQHANNIESAFDAFHPGVYPPGYGMTTREWLEEIARLFEASLGPGRPA